MIAIVVSELYGKTQQIHFFNKESVVVVLIVCLRVTFTQNKKKCPLMIMKNLLLCVKEL